MVLKPGDQGSVFTERATGKPASPHDVEGKHGIKPGKGNAYIEFDAHEGEYKIVKNPGTGGTEYVFKGEVDLKNRKPNFRRNR